LETVDIYARRSAKEKRQLLSFVVSNLVLKGGNLEAVYTKKPFDLVAEGSLF